MKLFNLEKFVRDMKNEGIEIEGFICRRDDIPGNFNIVIPPHNSPSDILSGLTAEQSEKVLNDYWMEV